MAKTDDKGVKNAMDYQEHEATYLLFLWVSKWTIAFCIALMLGLMVMYPMHIGFVGGFIVFLLTMVASFFAIKR